MAEEFNNINAPQFYDFTASDDDDDADIFFDFNDSVRQISNLKISSRRSKSFDDLSYLQKVLDGVICRNYNEASSGPGQISYNSGVVERKIRNTSGNINSKSTTQRAASQESINRLAQPKHHFASTENLNMNEYVPVAEAVHRFQKVTPKRFHSKSKQAFHQQQFQTKLHITQPVAPNLMTSGRIRSTSDAPTREEQEWLEFKHHQQFKIKAKPLNRKILQGPMKPLVSLEKKAATVPEPFNLTEVHQKAVEQPKQNTEFHAQPVPKSLHEPFKVRAEKAPVTVCQTPTFMKRYVKSNSRPSSPEVQKEPKQTNFPLKKTQPLPFSFEVRNRMLKEKKEKFIQNYIDFEKKMREFHAKPIPKGILQSTKTGINSTITSQKSQKNESIENLAVQFKARPATVLQKKPFIPAKPEKPLTEITQFKLNTDLRAEERELFELRKKEKEEELARLKEQEELMMKQREEEEVKRFRKLAEYKAQPVRKYKEVQIQPSEKVTIPVSPNIGKNRTK